MSSNANTAIKGAGYNLIYWGGVPGRGEYVRLVLEYAGQDYTETNDRESLVSYLSNPSKSGHPPHNAPPILQLPSGKFLSQTSNILNYLAPKLGLAGDANADDVEGAELARAHVNQLVLTVLDLNSEAHEVHHPLGPTLYYEDQLAEAKLRAEDFRKNRIPKFLKYFATVLKCNAKDGESPQSLYLVGSKTTTADIALFHVLSGLEHALPKRMGALKGDPVYDGVWKLKQRIESGENLARYLASSRRKKFGLGVFRYYPELDAEE